MAEQLALVPRRATELVRRALDDTRVVVVGGARQVGKSTLAALILETAPGARAHYLDDASTRAAAQSDPAALVRHDGLVVLDEVQRVPNLLLAIKREVDRDPRPGRFLLTGSARLLGMRHVPDTLPGRAETIDLWPFSQGELGEGDDGFVDAVFTDAGSLPLLDSTLRKRDYVARALRGGYPEAVRRADSGRRARFFESYLSDLIARDIRQVAEIERTTELRSLLAALAANAAGMLVVQRLSRDLNLPATTLRRHLDALEHIYVVRRIPAWSGNLTTRAVATPKLIFADSGIAGHLLGLSERRAEHLGAPVGQLLENFALGELARQLTWCSEPVRLFHYRDRDGYEVDAVLERTSGELVGVEVKAAETVRAEDFRGLRRLARRTGDRFVGGYVLYAGEDSLSFGEGMYALPLECLWRW